MAAKKKRSPKKTKAITVYRSSPPVMYARPAAPAPIVVRSAPAKRRGGGGGGGRPHVGARVRKGVAIGGVILGYASKNVDAFKQVPKLMGSRLMTLALAGHYLAQNRPGGYIDHIATAATAIAAFNVGQAGGFAGAATAEAAMIPETTATTEGFDSW